MSDRRNRRRIRAMRGIAGFAIATLLLSLIIDPLSADYASDEWDEAYEQTRDEWNATVQTMKEAKPKLEGYLATYQKWENFF